MAKNLGTIVSEEHGRGEAGGSNVIASLLARVGFEISDSGLEGLHQKLESIHHVVSVIAGVEIIKGIKELGERFAGTAEGMESAAIQTGIASENLQRLQYAASQSAISSEDMTSALVRLNRQLFQAQKGSKGAQELFGRLGVSPEQLAGFSNVEEAFYAVEDGINALGSQQEKVAAVMQLFGRSGARYLKLITEGSKGTIELGKRAEEVGAIVSDSSIGALAKFEDSMSSFRLTLRSFLINFSGAFIGPITRGIRAIEEYFGKNKTVIVETLKFVANEFGYYTYIAMGYVRVFGELIRRSLYGGQGFGGVINKFLTITKDTILAVVRDVMATLKTAADNGSIKQLLDSLSSFMDHAKEAGSAAIDALSQFFTLLGGGVDTSGLDASNKALVLFLTTLQTIVDVMDLAFKSFIYFAKGQFGSDLYSLVSGMASDISLSSDRLRSGNNRVLGIAAGGVAQGMQSVSMMSAAAPSFATSVLASPQRSASAAPMNMVANVTINAMSPSDAGDIAAKTKQAVSDALGQAMNEARRDLSHPVLW